MKVLAFLTDGFETVEALAVIDVLRRAKINVITVSITGDKLVESAQNIKVQADSLISEIKCEKDDVMFLPGGPGHKAYVDCEALTDMLITHNNEGGRIAAICAAPGTLEYFNILEGKDCTSYPGCIEDKDKVNYIEDELVVVDKNIITSRGPATALMFALKILEELGYINEMEEIKESMLVNLYNKYAK